MKRSKIFNLMAGALVATIGINAWAQTSDAAAMSDQSTMAPAGQGSAKSARKANHALSNKVLHALSKGGIDTTGINVVAKGGAVVLEGSLTDPDAIDKAGGLAKGVSGVTSVKNALKVKDKGQ